MTEVWIEARMDGDPVIPACYQETALDEVLRRPDEDDEPELHHGFSNTI